jgi:hypothetical protein
MKRAAFAIAILTATCHFSGGTGAQTRFMYSSGQTLHPAYEGWTPNADGSFTMVFGYMNANWQQEFDIPIGPQNAIEPGGPDQGQPTHFYPRRNPFLFSVRVPADFGTKELIWTLTANGKTEKAYASLKSDYQIDPQVISTEVTIGEPITLTAMAKDPDNIPARRGSPKPLPEGQQVTISAAALYRPPSSIVAQSGPGLRFSWIVYRGNAAAVTFTPDQMKTWTDTRAYANSPWSPPWTIPLPPADNKWLVQATFNEPGTYVLRGIASDGSLFTYENVTVVVTK